MYSLQNLGFMGGDAPIIQIGKPTITSYPTVIGGNLVMGETLTGPITQKAKSHAEGGSFGINLGFALQNLGFLGGDAPVIQIAHPTIKENPTVIRGNLKLGKAYTGSIEQLAKNEAEGGHLGLSVKFF